MSEREFDFIIFGGAEVTGKYVLRNLVKWLEVEKRPRWIAIAGFNKSKLKVAVMEVSIQIDRNLNDVGLIAVDNNDEISLQTMCARSKIILNSHDHLTVKQRERLAKVCIEKRTHMLDINDEPDYLELLQLKYHEAAKAAGVYLIPSIGLNCVPIDLGIDFLKQQFLPSGRLHSAEAYISFQPTHHHHLHQPSQQYSHQFNSFLVNSIVQTSHRSNVNMYGQDGNNNNNNNTKVSKWIQSSRSDPIPAFSLTGSPSSSSSYLSTPTSLSQFRLTNSPIRSLVNFFPRKNKELSSWSIPITSNNIIWKSQQWFYEAYREPPTYFNQYLVVSHWYQITLIFLLLIYLTLLMWFTFSRKLLSSYPNLLTFGYLKSNLSIEEKNNNEGAIINNNDPSTYSTSSSFSIHLVGQGWDSPSDSSDGQYKFPPNKTIRVAIKGSESGYETTSLILIQSGLTILEETSSMPYKGGCLTPAFAFRYTSLRDRLSQRGLEFKILHH